MQGALEAYIQDHVGGNRSPKTIDWHQTALGLFISFLADEEAITLIAEIDAMHITAWFVHLRTTPGGHGRVRCERTIQTHEEARSCIFEYIVAFYNRVRKHSTLGYLSPVQFEIVHS